MATHPAMLQATEANIFYTFSDQITSLSKSSYSYIRDMNFVLSILRPYTSILKWPVSMTHQQSTPNFVLNRVLSIGIRETSNSWRSFKVIDKGAIGRFSLKNSFQVCSK